MSILSIFGKRKESDEFRSAVRGSTKREDPLDKVRRSLKDLKEGTYKDYGPQPSGDRTWWVLSYDENDKTRVDGPYYNASDADEKLRDFGDGEVFELRNVEKKSEAKKVITKMLEKRLEESMRSLQGLK